LSSQYVNELRNANGSRIKKKIKRRHHQKW